MLEGGLRKGIRLGNVGFSSIYDAQIGLSQ